jgi:predicted RNA binding protein YcfA (HicA-like mRNA interferase family)
MKYKVLSNREFEKILKNNGYVVARTSGGHTIWQKGNDSITVNHSINPMVMRRLIKEHQLITD